MGRCRPRPVRRTTISCFAPRARSPSALRVAARALSADQDFAGRRGPGRRFVGRGGGVARARPRQWNGERRFPIVASGARDRGRRLGLPRSARARDGGYRRSDRARARHGAAARGARQPRRRRRDAAVFAGLGLARGAASGYGPSPDPSASAGSDWWPRCAWVETICRRAPKRSRPRYRTRSRRSRPGGAFVSRACPVRARPASRSTKIEAQRRARRGRSRPIGRPGG